MSQGTILGRATPRSPGSTRLTMALTELRLGPNYTPFHLFIALSTCRSNDIYLRNDADGCTATEQAAPRHHARDDTFAVAKRKTNRSGCATLNLVGTPSVSRETRSPRRGTDRNAGQPQSYVKPGHTLDPSPTSPVGRTRATHKCQRGRALARPLPSHERQDDGSMMSTIRCRSSIVANSTVILPLDFPRSTFTRVSNRSESRSARSTTPGATGTARLGARFCFP